MSLHQEYSGSQTFRRKLQEDGHTLLVAVECELEGFDLAFYALFDTAATWSVLSRDIARAMKLTGAPYDERLSTRLGIVQGTRKQIPVRFLADDGDVLDIDATWFISEEWSGPTVIGWDGCLESVRFALNPGDRLFCFAAVYE